MRRVNLIAVLGILSVTKAKLSSDFITGFETGAFIRNDGGAFADYSCPKPEIVNNHNFLGQINDMIAPMKLMAGMVKGQDEKLSSVIGVVETFLLSINEMTAILGGNYDGGDFCSGLIFGKDSATMLTEIAVRFTLTPPDDHNPALKLTPAQQEVIDAITDNQVVVFAKSYCGLCKKTKELLRNGGFEAKIIDIDLRDDGKEIQDFLQTRTGQRTVPNIFIGGEHIGGNDDIQALNKKGELAVKLDLIGVSHTL